MAQYFTDFTEYLTGSAPADWTVGPELFSVFEIQDSATSGLRVLRAEVDAFGDRYASWDETQDIVNADVEILVSFRYFSGDYFEVAARLSENTNGPDCYRVGYFADRRRIHKSIDGDLTLLSTTAPATDYKTGKRFLRAQLTGTNIKAKYWAAEDPEPETWFYETSDTDITTPGLAALFFRNQLAIEVESFAVGTNGDPSPTGPVSSGTPFSEPLTPKTDNSDNIPLLAALGQSQTLTVNMGTSAPQSQTLNAGSAQALAGIQDASTTLALDSTIGIRETAIPILSTAQTQLLELVSGLTVAIFPTVDTSALQTLNLVSGVSESLVVALVPETDTSALQDLQERLGSVQAMAAETDQGVTVPLVLVAGSSIPFSAQIAPASDASALQTFTLRAGNVDQADPALDTSGTVTLDSRTGQVVSLAPVTDSASLVDLQLFTGVIIGAFRTSSVIDVSPRYATINKTPVYSVKEI